jgi:hypothetical protein
MGLSSPSGVAEAIAALIADGYAEGIEVTAEGIWCNGCRQHHPAAGMLQERIYRFEGPSNPDDLSIVVGVRCRSCGLTGIVVSPYGPNADPRLFDILMQIPMSRSAHDP